MSLDPTCHELIQLTFLLQGRPELEELYDCQVAMVDYHNTDALRFLLQGVNLVISTIPGVEQLSLIEASRAARVDRFIPSEFEGLVSQRPMPEHDPYISKGSAEARALLRRYSRSKSAPLNYTIFSCGMFYERFGPGGLQARGMGASFEILGQRDCMIDIDHGYAQVPTTGPDGRAIHIALTSAYDVARLVVAALDLGISNWPHEFKMYGSKLPSVQLSQICSETMGGEKAAFKSKGTFAVLWLSANMSFRPR